MFHRSERLLLRPIWPEDWQGIYNGIADEGVVRNLARAPWPYQEQDARYFAQMGCEPRFPCFLITRASDAAVVGCIGIDAMDKGEVELGYWIARPYWGQGFATEAGCGAIKVAAALGHKQVTASHFLDNPASGKVLRKIGFVSTGRVVQRHSRGRGATAPVAEFALDLDPELSDAMRMDQKHAA